MSKISTQKITPYLWYDNQAKEAATFYCSLFENSQIISDSDLIVEFELDGMRLVGLNGGPQFKFTEAVSLLVLCEDQDEVDYFWNAFTQNGGKESRCGWCKDKYGFSWQIVPKRFMEMMKTGTPDQVKRVMSVLMPMNKLIVEEFEKAFN
ncbi:MAG: VOC family protein [Bacteroidetes bacterium]|nr:VOC family protein [Bacteroidota bacterium]MCB0845223.1 VOC family protein [Bacteroidota bacterium]MCB0851429.1 VOC family protein [Bacteroidota bacterium]